MYIRSRAVSVTISPTTVFGFGRLCFTCLFAVSVTPSSSSTLDLYRFSLLRPARQLLLSSQFVCLPMSTPTQEEHSFGIRNALDTVNCSEAFAWEQPASIMGPITFPMNVDCDSQTAEVTTLEPSHSVHHDSLTSSGSTEYPNISPARPQRNARNPTGTGHVDKFPRPKPRDRTEFSPEAMEKMVESFDENPYPGIDERVRLATLAGVEEGRIQVWFQNRRARSRRNRGHTPASRASVATTTTTAASVPSSEQQSTQRGQKKKNPKRKRRSSSSARDSKENRPPPDADESATPTVSGDAKRRRVTGPLTSERPESVRPTSESSSSEPSAFRKSAVPAVPTSAVRSSNQSKPRLHSFFVADILSPSSSGPDSAACRNLQPSSSGSAVHTTSQSGASVSGTKSPNPSWPVTSTSSITATPFALPTSSPFIQPLCLSSYPTPAAACPPFVPLVPRQPSDPYLHLRPSPQQTIPRSRYVNAFSSPASSRTTPAMSTPVTAFSGPYGRASAVASTPAPFPVFPSYSSGLLTRFGLVDATYSPVAGSFYSPLLPQAPVYMPTAAAAASPLTLGLGQFHSTLRHADVTSKLLIPPPTKDAHSSPKPSSLQSPVGSAGEPAKESIDLNDTVFVDVEGDVSDTEKHIDMRDSGFGSSADISL
ncbi:hypothetical protein BaRGS_00022239 [Batillaria attramentaria]|uniref:Homeobox domain-containing protein n=1 Tax=Batillaria attramentaria TaxID=370345 RepID=A0ABD0KHM2_9CAEN